MGRLQVCKPVLIFWLVWLSSNSIDLLYFLLVCQILVRLQQTQLRHLARFKTFKEN